MSRIEAWSYKVLLCHITQQTSEVWLHTSVSLLAELQQCAGVWRCQLTAAQHLPVYIPFHSKDGNGEMELLEGMHPWISQVQCLH